MIYQSLNLAFWIFLGVELFQIKVRVSASTSKVSCHLRQIENELIKKRNKYIILFFLNDIALFDDLHGDLLRKGQDDWCNVKLKNNSQKKKKKRKNGISAINNRFLPLLRNHGIDTAIAGIRRRRASDRQIKKPNLKMKIRYYIIFYRLAACNALTMRW